jgi:hypothetical protein
MGKKLVLHDRYHTSSFKVPEDVEILVCAYCDNLQEIILTKNIKELHCNSCHILQKIQYHPEGNLEVLAVRLCKNLRLNLPENLSMFILEGNFSGGLIPPKSLESIKIIDCDILHRLCVYENLVKLTCENCPNLTEIIIPKNSQLMDVQLHECRILTNISEKPCDALMIFHGCPWLKGSTGHTQNLTRLRLLQNFFRKSLVHKRFSRWIKSQEFTEWFYHPDNFGGYKTKLSISRFLNKCLPNQEINL